MTGQTLVPLTSPAVREALAENLTYRAASRMGEIDEAVSKGLEHPIEHEANGALIREGALAFAGRLRGVAQDVIAMVDRIEALLVDATDVAGADELYDVWGNLSDEIGSCVMSPARRRWVLATLNALGDALDEHEGTS